MWHCLECRQYRIVTQLLLFFATYHQMRWSSLLGTRIFRHLLGSLSFSQAGPGAWRWDGQFGGNRLYKKPWKRTKAELNTLLFSSWFIYFTCQTISFFSCTLTRNSLLYNFFWAYLYLIIWKLPSCQHHKSKTRRTWMLSPFPLSQLPSSAQPGRSDMVWQQVLIFPEEIPQLSQLQLSKYPTIPQQ